MSDEPMRVVITATCIITDPAKVIAAGKAKARRDHGNPEDIKTPAQALYEMFEFATANSDGELVTEIGGYEVEDLTFSPEASA